jgi:hypothetical protein
MPFFNSILKPSDSVQIGVLTGVVDVLVYQHFLPTVADVRTATPNNGDVETARRQAAITALGVNSLVALMTRDWNVFLIGGLVIASIDLVYKHANAVHPQTGRMTAPGETTISPDLSAAYPMPDYSDEEAA